MALQASQAGRHGLGWKERAAWHDVCEQQGRDKVQQA